MVVSKGYMYDDLLAFCFDCFICIIEKIKLFVKFGGGGGGGGGLVGWCEGAG